MQQSTNLNKLKSVLLTLTFVLCTLIISTCAFSLKAEAKEKSYEINNFDANVSFDYDGNAYITEKWTLTFDGDFSRFYKDFRLYDLTTVEDFDNFSIISVKINDVPCDYIGDELNDARPKYTFYFYKSGDNYTLQWNYPVEDDTVTYEVKYRLDNVVKLSEENPENAIFCYRFVGKNFEKNIRNATITIENPGIKPIEIGYSTKKVDTTEENNNLTMQFKNSSGLVKFNLHLDSSAFSSNLYYTQDNDIEEFNSSNKGSTGGSLMVIGIIGLSLLCTLLPIILSMYLTNYGKKIYRKLKEYPNILNEFIWSLEQNGVHPLAVADRGVGTSQIRVEIGWLLYKGNLYKQDNKLFLVNTNNLLQEELRFLEVLFKEHQELNGQWFIDSNNLSYVLKSDSLKLQLSQYADALAYSTYKRATKNNKEIKQTITAVRKYFMHDSKDSIDYITNTLANNDNLQYIDIYSKSYMELIRSYYIMDKENIIRSSRLRSTFLDTDDYFIDDILDDEITKDYVSHTSSHSSGGSSCSSCSSCSGCGGGGAD